MRVFNCMSICKVKLTTLVVAIVVSVPTVSRCEEAKEKLDARIVGHYVRLVSDEREDSPWGMKFLRQMHSSCVANHKVLGKPYLTEPSGGWPKSRVRAEREIYYSRTRTAHIDRIYSYQVKRSNCDLEDRLLHKITLRSAAGGCVAILDKKISYGQCNTDVHRRMTASPPKFKYDNGFRRIGEQEISGHKCVLFKGTQGGESCIANPRSDFPIPDALGEGMLPGLQLQGKNAIYDLKADIVRLHVEFPESVFSIPKGLRHLPVPSYENRYKEIEEGQE